MNTNMTRLRWFLKYLCHCDLDESIASALEGLSAKANVCNLKVDPVYNFLPLLKLFMHRAAIVLVMI